MKRSLLTSKFLKLSLQVFLLVGLLNLELIAQKKDSLKIDSIAYSPEFLLKDGLYLSINQLYSNKPILKSNLKSEFDPNHVEFISKSMEKDFIEFKDADGNFQKVKTSGFWGYCQNGAVHINYKDKFYRVLTLGSVTQFLAVYKETQYVNQGGGFGYPNYGYGYPYYGNNNTVPVTTTVTNLYLMDYKTGEAFAYNYDRAVSFIALDKELYDEFMKLKKRDKKKLITSYLRRYNDKHPIKFPLK